MDSNNNGGCYADRFERLFESGRVFHETPNEVPNQMIPLPRANVYWFFRCLKERSCLQTAPTSVWLCRLLAQRDSYGRDERYCSREATATVEQGIVWLETWEDMTTIQHRRLIVPRLTVSLCSQVTVRIHDCSITQRREIPNLNRINGVIIGQKKKCRKKVSPHSSSWRNTNLHPNCCEWSSWFTKLVLCSQYIFHIGVRHLGLLIANSPLRDMWRHLIYQFVHPNYWYK